MCLCIFLWSTGYNLYFFQLIRDENRHETQSLLNKLYAKLRLSKGENVAGAMAYQEIPRKPKDS